MAHVGQELALDLIGRFRRLLGLVQFAGSLLHKLLQMIAVLAQIQLGLALDGDVFCRPTNTGELAGLGIEFGQPADKQMAQISVFVANRKRNIAKRRPPIDVTISFGGGLKPSYIFQFLAQKLVRQITEKIQHTIRQIA